MTKQDYERLAKAAVAIRKEFRREMLDGWPQILIADRSMLDVLFDLVIDQLALACSDQQTGLAFNYQTFRKACKGGADD